MERMMTRWLRWWRRWWWWWWWWWWRIITIMTLRWSWKTTVCLVLLLLQLLPEAVLISYRSPRGIYQHLGTWQILLCCKLSKYPSSWDSSRKQLLSPDVRFPPSTFLCSLEWRFLMFSFSHSILRCRFFCSLCLLFLLPDRIIWTPPMPILI